VDSRCEFTAGALQADPKKSGVAASAKKVQDLATARARSHQRRTTRGLAGEIGDGGPPKAPGRRWAKVRQKYCNDRQIELIPAAEWIASGNLGAVIGGSESERRDNVTGVRRVRPPYDTAFVSFAVR